MRISRIAGIAAVLVAVAIVAAILRKSPGDPGPPKAGPPEIVDKATRPSPEVRTDLSLARLKGMAAATPQDLVDLVQDETLELQARVRAVGLLVQGIPESQLKVLARLMTLSTPPEILVTVFRGLASRECAGLESELADLLDVLVSDGRFKRDVIVEGLEALAATPGLISRELLLGFLSSRAWREHLGDVVKVLGPKMERKEIAGILSLYVSGGRSDEGSRESLQRFLHGLVSANPDRVAECVGSLVAGLPQSTTEEVNAKNRIVATLMSNKSDSATAVLEVIASAPDGKHAQIQALHALANVDRPRSGEILAKVLSTAADPEVHLEAARVARRLRADRLKALIPVLEKALDSGDSDVSVALASSLMEATRDTARGPELVALATRAAESFSGAQGRASGDLLVYLAEYAADPALRLSELYGDPAVGWRVMKSKVIHQADLAPIKQILIKVVEGAGKTGSSDVPDRERLKAAGLLAKAGALEPIRESLFAAVERTENPRVAAEFAQLIRDHGREEDGVRLRRLIESLPAGPRRKVLERE